MRFAVIEFVRMFLKFSSKIVEVIIFHSKITKSIDCDETTIRIVVHAFKILDDFLDFTVRIFSFVSKPRLESA